MDVSAIMDQSACCHYDDIENVSVETLKMPALGGGGEEEAKA